MFTTIFLCMFLPGIQLLLSHFHWSYNVPSVDSEEFRELLQIMDSKYQVPHRKGVSQEDEQDIQSFRGNNSIVVEQSHNH